MRDQGCAFGFRVRGFRVWALGFRVEGPGFGFETYGVGLIVLGSVMVQAGGAVLKLPLLAFLTSTTYSFLQPISVRPPELL